MGRVTEYRYAAIDNDDEGYIFNIAKKSDTLLNVLKYALEIAHSSPYGVWNPDKGEVETIKAVIIDPRDTIVWKEEELEGI